VGFFGSSGDGVRKAIFELFLRLMVRGLDVRAGILRLDGGEHVCGRAHAHLA
jgi:hypothetical protein